MIKFSTVLPDDFDDEILQIIKFINARNRWDKQKRSLRKELIDLLEASGYLKFTGQVDRYLISRVGESYLYDVPLYKRGVLSGFKGKRIRVVCTASGRYGRGYMAGVVMETPRDRIVTKLVQKYSFPDYVNNHEIVYKSPRFVVFLIDRKISILSDDASCGYIKIVGWNSILLDGKAGGPIATLYLNADGTVRGKLTRWVEDSTFETLKEATAYLAKAYRR